MPLYQLVVLHGSKLISGTGFRHGQYQLYNTVLLGRRVSIPVLLSFEPE